MADAPQSPSTVRRWWHRKRWLLPLLAATLLLVAFAGLNWLDSPQGQHWLIAKVAQQEFKSGLAIHIRKVEGSLFDRARVKAIELHDLKGTFLILHDTQIDWRPGKILRKQIIISTLHIKDAQWLRRPVLNPSDPDEPLLPDFDIDIGDLQFDQLRLAPAVVGERYTLKGRGDLHIAKRALRTNLLLDAIGSPDHADIRLIAEPERNRFDIAASIKAERGGVLARLAGWQPGYILGITGKGDYQRWNGHLKAVSDAAPLADLILQMRRGTLSATGIVSPHPALPQNIRDIIASAPNLIAQASLARPLLTASVGLSGAQAKANVRGQINLESAHIIKTTATVVDPQGQWLGAILPDTSGRAFSLKADISGPLKDPDINADASADDFALAGTTLNKLTAQFVGKIGPRSFGDMSLKAAGVITGVKATDDYLQNISATAQIDSSNGNIILRDMRAISSTASLRGDINYRLATGAIVGTIRSGAVRIDTGNFGRLPLTFNGAFTRMHSRAPYGLAINAVADARNWQVPVELKRALGSAPRLDGRARLEASGKLIADQLTLQMVAGRFSGSGSYHNRQIDARLSGTISNLKVLAPDLPVKTKAALPISLAIAGSIDDPKINAELRSDDLSFGGFRAQNMTVLLAPQDARDWRVGVRAQSDFGALDASAVVRRGAQLKLENLTGSIGPAMLSGTVVQSAAGPWQGDVRAQINADAGEKGSFDVVTVLSAMGSAQSVDFNISGANLDRRYQQERLLADALQAKGKLTLGKAPTLLLNAQAKNLRWRDYALNSLNIDGGGPLAAAKFNYTAAGARGVDFVAAGSISTNGGSSIDSVTSTLDGKIGNQSLRFASPARFQRLKGGWQLLPTKVQLGRGTIDLRGARQGAETTADINMAAMPLDFIELLLPGFGITGNGSGTAKIAFRGDKLIGAEGALALNRLRRTGLFQSAPTLELASQFNLDAAGLNISATASTGGKSAGTLALLIKTASNGSLANGSVRGKFLWDGPVDALSGLSGFDAHDLRGPLRMDADISGQVQSPDLDGTVLMTGGRYENLALGLTATDLRLVARFKGSNIALESATAKLVGGGTLSAKGMADLSAERGFPVKMLVSLSKAAILKRDDLDVIASGDLDVVFGANVGKISGPLKLDRMRLNASTSTTPEDIPQVAYKERNAVQSAQVAALKRVAAPWDLEIAVKAPQNIFVGGLGLLSEWGGNFNIVGTTQAPALSGQLQVIRGTYEFAGRRFNIDRGTVNFQSKDRINPVLNVQASARINDVTGLITIQGTAQKPLIGFSSNPNLPKDEVMARILFGTSIDKLSPLEGAQLAGAIAQLSQGGARKLNVFGQVSKLTRIDRLRVLPANEQIGSGTAISAGKYIGDRLYVEAATDGRGYTATNIEVTLTRALSILSQIATLGGTNVNIKWSKDY